MVRTAPQLGGDGVSDMTQEFLLRLSEVSETVGLRRTAIYEAIRRNDFPKPVRVGSRAVRWRLTELQQWIAQRERAGGAK
ncbi:AlpA family phage regulatory protein [Thiomonas sp.]|jgi:prophage regulatory protein|uniref:helix-turn-helix transcriptional regulator n=1 Tax=Thiomonas sp. TaxID=2047785 RepID=UPI0017692A79|nr:AlpA family phage regulatory protein [Thiomonas sp.]